MLPVLALVDADTVSLPAWLAEAGCPPASLATVTTLTHQIGVLTSGVAPQLIVAAHVSADAVRLAELLLRQPAPAAFGLCLISDALDDELLARLSGAGVLHAWASPRGLDGRVLRSLLMQAQARWRCEVAWQTELIRVREQLDERKWVERAKGVLMQAHTGAKALGEDEAFRLLRGAAMQTNLRMGEVSRAVYESARWAEAINRAGQLRMLSQRLVKLAAQRLAGVDARRARTLQHQATQRAQDNLDHLATLPALAHGPAGEPLVVPLRQTLLAWAALKEALEQRQTPATLAQTDAHAEALLTAAETLTGALEARGGRQALRIINLCGRQRMRVQRLAKTALLAELLAEPARHESLVPLLDEFEATLQELERAPLSTSDIRQNLAAAREEWLRLLRGLRTQSGASGVDPRAALAGSADALLDLFDQLTAAYEHSLQVIMA